MPNNLKKHIIQSVATLVDLPHFNQNKIVLVTPYGVIQGIPVRKPIEDDGVSIAISAFDEAAKIWSEQNSAPEGNDGYFLLSDVTIHGDSHRFKLPVLAVFYDQIVGVTLANL